MHNENINAIHDLHLADLDGIMLAVVKNMNDAGYTPVFELTASDGELVIVARIDTVKIAIYIISAYKTESNLLNNEFMTSTEVLDKHWVVMWCFQATEVRLTTNKKDNTDAHKNTIRDADSRAQRHDW